MRQRHTLSVFPLVALPAGAGAPLPAGWLAFGQVPGGPPPGGAFGPPPGGAFGPPPGGAFGPPPGGPFGPMPGGSAFGPLPGGPRKKSKKGLFIGCGCLSLFGAALLFGGYLLYQEEGRGLHVPDSEVESVPVTPGVPFVIRFKWEGTGYAFNNVWLVVDDGKKSGGDFAIKGTFGCSAGESIKKIETKLTDYGTHDRVDKGGDAFSAWLLLGDEYTRSSSRTIECAGIIEPAKGSWTRAHVAVTQRQRPSDFFAF
jgi:hypothetical protein